jgi:hypothetical protein
VLLNKHDVRFRRPSDYFAEMLKTDGVFRCTASPSSVRKLKCRQLANLPPLTLSPRPDQTTCSVCAAACSRTRRRLRPLTVPASSARLKSLARRYAALHRASAAGPPPFF